MSKAVEAFLIDGKKRENKLSQQCHHIDKDIGTKVLGLG